MKLAVLLLSCTGTGRVTTIDRAWVHTLVGHVAGYLLDQSGGRENMQFRVLDWFELPHTSQQWNDLGFGAGPVVRPLVAAGLGVDLSPYDRFALVIDKFDAQLAAVAPDGIHVHVGAQSLDPALLQHELGHFLGAAHANLDTATGPQEYGDRLCVMGSENAKYSFVHAPLARRLADGSLDTNVADSGPGMAAPALRACNWLDLARHGVDISAPLDTGTRRTSVDLAPLRGAPAPNAPAGRPVCAWADGVVPGQRLLLHYRARDSWDRGMPATAAGAPGWIVAHLTGPEPRSTQSLQIGAVEATPGASIQLSKGALRLTVGAASPGGVTLVAEVEGPVAVDRGAPAVASWGQGRLDIFARGLDKAAWHKAWAAAWHPSPVAWEALGGGFTTPLAVSAWGPNRLDIFGIGTDQGMWHKAWAQAWHPSQAGWENLGGKFTSPPAVASWGPDRLDIFGIGTDQGMWHKAWAQAWHPSQLGWENLGGKFTSPPAVASWGPNRLDIFALGLDGAMYHKAWANVWHPSPAGWEALGGKFTSPPAVVAWGPDRLDIFALGTDRAVWHKAWDNGWHPSPDGWEPLGGKFLSPPAVTSWSPGRLDIFGIGLDGAMYHKAWANGWHPSPDGWEFLGGTFASPPTAVAWGPNRLDIFAVGKDQGIWHKAWADRWHPSTTGWEPLAGGFV